MRLRLTFAALMLLGFPALAECLSPDAALQLVQTDQASRFTAMLIIDGDGFLDFRAFLAEHTNLPPEIQAADTAQVYVGDPGRHGAVYVVVFKGGCAAADADVPGRLMLLFLQDPGAARRNNI